jgi:branched-chain amino acid transport system permease protein
VSGVAASEDRAVGASGGLLLDATGVTKHFGGVKALEDVDFHVREGEVVGLVGPNGSGKSTLINVLSGRYRPSGGRIRFEQRDLAREAAHRIARLGIARTYQIPQPFPSLTVRDNVAVSLMFGRSALSLDEARESAHQYLESCGIEHLADALPAKANLHQRKFLELARALAAQPRVLMLDEVMAGLTPSEVGESVAMIRKVHDSGVTLIVVEHLMRVVTELATRIVVLNRGRVLAEGEPKEVMSRDDVVSTYLGRERDAS